MGDKNWNFDGLPGNIVLVIGFYNIHYKNIFLASDIFPVFLIISFSKVLVEFDARWPSSGIVHLTAEIGAHLRQSSIVLLSDDEVRIRIAAGDLLGALGRKYGVSIYEDSKGNVIDEHLKGHLCIK